MKNVFRYLLGACVVGISAFPVLAAVKPEPVQSGIQLVQSFPAETTLEVAGIPKTEDVWLGLIQGAKTSIDLAQFYISSEPKILKATQSSESGHSGESGVGSTAERPLLERPLIERPMEKIISELEKAGARGVKIRLMISEAMANEDPMALARIKKIKDVQVRSLNLLKVSNGVHHAKYWVVDRSKIFLGSQNMDWRSLRQIHELGVSFEDSETAKQIARIFELDWKMAKTQEAPVYTGSTVSFPDRAVELVASPALLTPPDVRPAIQALVELLEGAKKSIQIQTMEYSPASGNHYWSEIDNALRSAALRGVKIQIVVPENNVLGRPGDYLKSLAMLPGVEVKWVKIPKWTQGEVPYGRLIRSKYMIVDESLFWIGNSNWTKGYFYNSRNLELIFNRPELAKQGLQVFQKVWESSYSKKLDAAKSYEVLK